jgi:biotin transport system substrate-specific component
MIIQAQTHLQRLTIDFPKTVFVSKAIALSILIAISAQIFIPLKPIPVALHPTMVLAIGFACQPRLAIAGVLAYILEAILGLPVLHGLTGGIHRVLGPTGGYVLGFIPLVAVVSYCKGVSASFARLFAVGLLANIPLYILGVFWLSFFVGISSAIQLGLLPFLLKIPVEVAFAVLTCRLVHTAARYLEKI